MKPGIYKGTRFETYARWDAINWHTIEPYGMSNKHGRHRELFGQDTTDAFEDGEAFHTSILEPDRFSADYRVMPNFPGNHNSNAYKDKRNAWLDENRDKATIDEEQLAALEAMRSAVYIDPIAGPIMRAKGTNEVGIVWEDSETGLLLKARLDRVCRLAIGYIDISATDPEMPCMVSPDFKTMRENGLHAINGAIAKYGYSGQIAMQYDGIRALTPDADPIPMIIAVCKPPRKKDFGPYDVVCVDMRSRLDYGRRLYRKLLGIREKARKENKYYGAAEGRVVTLHTNQWEEEKLSTGNMTTETETTNGDSE